MRCEVSGRVMIRPDRMLGSYRISACSVQLCREKNVGIDRQRRVTARGDASARLWRAPFAVPRALNATADADAPGRNLISPSVRRLYT